MVHIVLPAVLVYVSGSGIVLVLFSALRHAAQRGINLMTFEDEQELIKIQRLYPAAR